MIQRNEVVLSVLRELQDATESSGLEALTRVAVEVDQILSPFQLPRSPCQSSPQWAGVDDAARRLYPADAPGDLLPLKCKGEGNLLFDAVSLLLVGDTELSLELQVSRRVCEVLMWTFVPFLNPASSCRFAPWWRWCCGRGTTCRE